MFKYALVLVVIFVQSLALAQSPEAKQAIEFCETKYQGETSTARLQQVLCIQEQNLRILEQRMHQGESGLKAEVERLRKELEAAKAISPAASAAQPTQSVAEPAAGKVADARAEIERRMAELAAGKAKPAQPAVPPVALPPPARPAPMSSPLAPAPPAPIFAGGVPYRIVPTPGQFAASTFDIDESRVWLQSLARGADKHAYGATSVRVVIKRDGVPLLIMQADGMIEPTYADLNNDGREDRKVYSAVDPFMVDNIYIPLVGPKTKIEVVYLVPTGKNVEIQGFPRQILWGDPQRVQLDRVQRMGRWIRYANGGWPL
jgi:hypothetical protein